MTGRRGLGYRIGQWCCWTIGIQTVGGVGWYALLAGSWTTVLLLIALVFVAWAGHHWQQWRRRALAAWASRTGHTPWQ